MSRAIEVLLIALAAYLIGTVAGLLASLAS